ncbi:MAG: hypothetical protein IK002_00390 [Treponema sp.]|uniref:hypothetical protein n=1 Tax=Treponema sp. TaxID=166 RepID=UPI00298DF211|nr:hypothetical protein [Treponema sp.]MBR5932422.1 hypothetical protein [Treponema sp.]
MKKYLNSFCAVFVLAASLLVTGCKAPSGGGGGSKNVIVNTAVTGSEVFIDGRSVEIYAKWICDHEVTQKEFKDIMGSDAKYDSYSEYGYGEGNNYPVYYVSWYDAITVDTPSTGPTSASQRKIRGGGFFDSKDKCTTGYRNLGWDSGTFYQPGKKADLGFRVCRSAQ